MIAEKTRYFAVSEAYKNDVLFSDVSHYIFRDGLLLEIKRDGSKIKVNMGLVSFLFEGFGREVSEQELVLCM